VVQQQRPQLIREESVTALQDIESLQKKLQLTPSNAAAKPETVAGQAYLNTLITAHTTELKMLDIEATSNPVRVELLKTQLHLQDIQKNALSKVVTALTEQLSSKRQQDAKDMHDSQLKEEKELSGKHPLIQTLTHQNFQYTQDLQNITSKIADYTGQKAKLELQGSAIDSDFKSAEQKISLAGLSPALGNILREQRRNLLTPEQSSLLPETILNETASTSLEQIQLEAKLKQFSDVEAELKDNMQQVDLNLPLAQRMAIQAELRVLLNSQQELLDKLAVASTAYLRLLGDLDFARQQTVKQATKYATYLDEHLLWIKSTDPINTHYLNHLYLAITWLLAPHNWLIFLEDILDITLHSFFLPFVGILSFALLLLSKKWVINQLSALSIEIKNNYTDSFIATLEALIYTLILVSPIPLFSYYFGWLISSDVHVTDFTQAVGKGLQSAALSLLFLQFFYLIFAAEGIAIKHFKWPENTARLFHQQIAWFRYIAVITAFIIHSTAASHTLSYSDALGRFAFMISMLAMLVFSSKLLNPNHGVLKNTFNNSTEIWIKLRYVWYLAVICIPLVIIGFAVAGYYLSALELQTKLILALRLIFVMIIMHEMVIRWLTLVNRQLVITNVKQKLKTAVIADTQQPQSEDLTQAQDEQTIDIPKINAQTIRLLNLFIGLALVIGFWMILKNILPAFSFLEGIVLWQHPVIIDNQASYQPITLINLILAGIYFFIVLVSVRNFSGVMELLVFSRLSKEPGTRYAVNQLAKYTLLTLGFISIANELGGNWSQVQWLVAALSVGLGFGVQEIFANMVSGVILLVERPIRVGDTVSIDGVTGKILHIQMRATTLLDLDQKQLIVPNKTFITSRLVNWTLSNPITHVEVLIGIAYGSNVELALKLMLDTVKLTPKVLAEPVPSVLFIKFA
jgi:potassium efflux system protein